MNIQKIENLKSLYDKCLEYKELGNKEFTSNDGDDTKKRAQSYYQLTIKLYNENFNRLSAATTLENDMEIENKLKKLMSIIYSNLSLIYIKNIEIDKALQCSELAIKLDGTSNSKSFYRNSIAKRSFCKYNESLESLDKAIQVETANSNSGYLNKQFLKEKKEIQDKIQKSVREEKEFKERMNRDEKSFQQFPNISVVYKQGYGRVTLANKAMDKNEIIYRVAPFSSSVEDELVDEYCGFCFQSIEKSQRQKCLCSKCKLYSICNGCRSINNGDGNTALNYHNEFCDIFTYLNKNFPKSESRDFRLMIRVFVNIVLGRQGKDSRNPTIYAGEASNDGRPYISDSHIDFISLSRDTRVVDPEQLAKFKRGASSVYNVISDVRGKQFFKHLTKEEMLALYSTVLANAHSFSTALDDIEIGRGIFPSGCYINHSCSPNATWYIDNQGMMVYTTLKEIAMGEEIFVCYLDNTDILRDRRQHLLDQYSFFCKCQLCEFQSKLSGYLCEQCKEPLVEQSRKYHEPTNKSDTGSTLTCSKGHTRSFKIKKPTKDDPSQLLGLEDMGNPEFTDKRSFSQLNFTKLVMQSRSDYEQYKEMLTGEQFKAISNNLPAFLKRPDSEVFQEMIDSFNYLNDLFDQEDPSVLKAPVVFASFLQQHFLLFIAIKKESSSSSSSKDKLQQLKDFIIENIDKNQYNNFKNHIDKLLTF